VASTKNWEHAAGILWDALVRAAGDYRKPIYSELSPLIATNPLNVGRALGPIQEFCLDHDLPPLTAIVIGKISKKPGDGFIAWDIKDLDRAWNDVFAFDWRQLRNPYGVFDADTSISSLAEEVLRSPDQGGMIYRLVKDRGIAQRIFRAALIKAYAGECAFCGLSFVEALEGAHIVPWQFSTHEQRLDVRNGLLLCATHHRLFDRKIMAPTIDKTIQHYDPEERDGHYSGRDRAMTVKLHGRPIKLPTDKALWPDSAFIAHRRKADGWDRKR